MLRTNVGPFARRVKVVAGVCIVSVNEWGFDQTKTIMPGNGRTYLTDLTDLNFHGMITVVVQQGNGVANQSLAVEK
jgi:hypothetical protein